TILIEEDNGNKKIQVAYRDIINKKERNVVIYVSEFIMPIGETKYFPYSSGLYPSGYVWIDDNKYCQISDGQIVDYQTSHNDDGTFKDGYCSLYEYYKQGIGMSAIFPLELQAMYNLNNPS
ncbi:MAG TPA: hypothetical protein VN703_00505, partial [Candidatus Sulfopaludibacter sp.]|nr:hypothetical protein [Candidatus Sulfopaludibacter sp.]